MKFLINVLLRCFTFNSIYCYSCLVRIIKTRLLILKVYYFVLQLTPNYEDLGQAYKFLANYHLKGDRLEEAFAAAQRCTDFREVKSFICIILLWLSFNSIQCNSKLWSSIIYSLDTYMLGLNSSMLSRLVVFINIWKMGGREKELQFHYRSQQILVKPFARIISNPWKSRICCDAESQQETNFVGFYFKSSHFFKTFPQEI